MMTQNPCQAYKGAPLSIKKILSVMSCHLNEYKTQKALESLSVEQLDDIGLSVEAFEERFNKPFTK